VRASTAACFCVCSSQASESTRRSSHVPSDTASRLHGRDSVVGSCVSGGRNHHHHHQQQQQAEQQRRKSSKDVITGAVPGCESLFSSMPPSLAAAFELPGIHISRIETLDFDDDLSRSLLLSTAHLDMMHPFSVQHVGDILELIHTQLNFLKTLNLGTSLLLLQI